MYREAPDARAHCEKLQLASGGWRLPTIKELLTLVDPTRADPAIDPTWFPDTPAARFLSSTPNTPSPTFGPYPNDAWFVEFKSGATYTSGNNPSDFRVRCVR